MGHRLKYQPYVFIFYPLGALEQFGDEYSAHSRHYYIIRLARRKLIESVGETQGYFIRNVPAFERLRRVFKRAFP